MITCAPWHRVRSVSLRPRPAPDKGIDACFSLSHNLSGGSEQHGILESVYRCVLDGHLDDAPHSELDGPLSGRGPCPLLEGILVFERSDGIISSGSHFNESRLQTKECDHPTRIPWTCFTGFIRCRLSRSAKMHPEEMQLLRTDGRLYHSVDMINLVDAIHLPVESRAFHATGRCTGSSQTNVSVLHAAGFGFEVLDLLGARPVSHSRSATRSQVS